MAFRARAAPPSDLGIVVLDSENTIIWGNGRLREWAKIDTVIGSNFYTALGSPEILGPDFCPFHTAMATGRNVSAEIARWLARTGTLDPDLVRAD